MKKINELVINFHMTESCNYRCSYCYATWNELASSSELHRHPGKINSLFEVLAAYFLHDNPLKKHLGYHHVRINFAGGEPMLLGRRFIDAMNKAAQLGFKTSIITNGHFLDTEMLQQISPYLSVLGISFDTADRNLAYQIGRSDRKKQYLSSDRLIDVCQQYRLLNPKGVLKINTVVNLLNYQDNLCGVINKIKPEKWKLLRVLPVHNHNLTITQQQYEQYIEQHSQFSNIISIEDNGDMHQSYLMINPEGCFYQNADAGTGYILSQPILTAGVDCALEQIPFNLSAFGRRYLSSSLKSIV